MRGEAVGPFANLLLARERGMISIVGILLCDWQGVLRHAFFAQWQSRHQRSSSGGESMKLRITLLISSLIVLVAIGYSVTVIYSSAVPTVVPVTPGRPSLPSTPTPALPGRVPTEPNAPFARPPSVTPLPISKSTDLARGVPDAQKRVYVVRRANGVYEQFILPSDYFGDKRQLMGLSLQDTIVDEYPFIVVHASPPAPTRDPRLATPISNPYP